MPEPFRILLSKQAAADLQSIFDPIAQDSPTIASRVVERILNAMEQLATFPHRNIVRGQPANAPHPVRSLPVQSWIVFFRVIEQQSVVRIVRVRHAAKRRPRRYD